MKTTRQQVSDREMQEKTTAQTVEIRKLAHKHGICENEAADIWIESGQAEKFNYNWKGK